MDKRGAGTEETLIFLGKLILILAFLIIIYVFYNKITGIFKPDDASIDSFKTLTSEINIMRQDFKENKEKTSANITVPLYMKKDYLIRALNYRQDWGFEKECGKSSCLMLSSMTKPDKMYAYFAIDDVEFAEQGAVVISSMDSIYKVELNFERRDGKQYLKITQIQ